MPLAALGGPKPGAANLLIILADDMGYSDIGCYGSEIATPNLDRLAAHGLRFSQFYNTGRCCPSRASLLTGLYPHQAGVGHMLGKTGLPGYATGLRSDTVTLAEVLNTAGYATFMTGKWHLGWSEEGSPTARGFEHFYGSRGYIDSYFSVMPGTDVYLDEKIVNPAGKPPINHLHPDQEWYTTDVFTDYALHFLTSAICGPTGGRFSSTWPTTPRTGRCTPSPPIRPSIAACTRMSVGTSSARNAWPGWWPRGLSTRGGRFRIATRPIGIRSARR